MTGRPKKRKGQPRSWCSDPTKVAAANAKAEARNAARKARHAAQKERERAAAAELAEAARQAAEMRAAEQAERDRAAAEEAVRKPRFVERVYTRIPVETTRPRPGLVTARPREDWWTEAERARPRRQVAIAEAGMPPAGRSALDMRMRGEG